MRCEIVSSSNWPRSTLAVSSGSFEPPSSAVNTPMYLTYCSVCPRYAAGSRTRATSTGGISL